MAAKNFSNWGKILERVQQQKRQFAVIANNNNGNQYPNKNLKSQLHVTAQQKYPAALPLPLPANIDPAETTRFSPNRARDITATAIPSHQANSLQYKVDITLDNSVQDPHVESYDCSGAVGLSAVMQSNVPTPYGGMHSFTHLNMPGGQWSQDSKFMSHNLQSSHYTNLRQQTRADWSNYNENATIDKGINKKQTLLQQLLLQNNVFAKKNNLINNNLHEQIRKYSTERSSQSVKTGVVDDKTDQKISSSQSLSSPSSSSSLSSPLSPPSSLSSPILPTSQVPPSENVEVKLTRREQLKRAVKEYGSTVIVFHIVISLISLEIFYLLVSSGIDVMPIVNFIGFGSTALSNKIASGASTFVIAYAIHKVFAPVRISMTLFASPLIVRYLRKKGFLKPKKS